MKTVQAKQTSATIVPLNQQSIFRQSMPQNVMIYHHVHILTSTFVFLPNECSQLDSSQLILAASHRYLSSAA